MRPQRWQITLRWVMVRVAVIAVAARFPRDCEARGVDRLLLLARLPGSRGWPGSPADLRAVRAHRLGHRRVRRNLESGATEGEVGVAATAVCHSDRHLGLRGRVQVRRALLECAPWRGQVLSVLVWAHVPIGLVLLAVARRNPLVPVGLSVFQWWASCSAAFMSYMSVTNNWL